MRPTWKAATIVEPFANVSGSTSVWWLVGLDALHVAWVNGSTLTCCTAASAAAAKVNAAVSATPTTEARRRYSDRSDGRIAHPPRRTTDAVSSTVINCSPLSRHYLF